MKPDIHPKYFEAKVHCGSCGTEWTVGSTRPELRVDVCSNCHPFFTGKQTIIDTAGQVERFQKRLERTAPSLGRSSPRSTRTAGPRTRRFDSRVAYDASARGPRDGCGVGYDSRRARCRRLARHDALAGRQPGAARPGPGRQRRPDLHRPAVQPRGLLDRQHRHELAEVVQQRRRRRGTSSPSSPRRGSPSSGAS